MEETLNLIKRRYIHERAIYTWCGIALVAVNPYQEQDIYGEQAVETYHSASHSVYLQLDPHIYAVTEDAYSKLERNLKNQSIIVSGESGAGKTVSAKHAMRYLASIASSKGRVRIENRVLASNPIMEAIGNASTVRNDNSSRFGKYIQIFFDRHNRKILGANMRTYLLEKSRVTKLQSGERNFHIFYQLLNHAYRNPSKMEFLRLIDTNNENKLFKFKFQGDTDPDESRDDLRKFNDALKTLNIDSKKTDIIYRIIAGILHAGNIEFECSGSVDDQIDQDSVCHVNEDCFHFKAFCDLVGLDAKETSERLTTRTLKSGRETIVQPLNKQRAEYGRDAMLKFLYECLFNWLVSLINLSLKKVDHEQDNNHLTNLSAIPKSPSTKKSIVDAIQHEPQFIGVLDIYGFENFNTNSFEQFCINYANEVLQQQYNQHVFKLEQEEYIREGIDWTFIEYTDNQPVIDVIESKPIGVLNLLDEECRMPKGSDQSWCLKLYEHLLPTPNSGNGTTPKKSIKYSTKASDARMGTGDSIFRRPRINYQNSFIIGHYAEEVTYDVATFLEKNRDTIAEEQSDLLTKSETISFIFEDSLSTSQQTPLKVNSSPRGIRSATVGHQFRGSLAALITTLNDTEPHYIRCIKPNDEKKAFVFNEERAVQQLKACGVYETIRISNNGFPSRWLYKDFAKRYCVLIYGTKTFENLANKIMESTRIVSEQNQGDPDNIEDFNSDQSKTMKPTNPICLSKFMRQSLASDIRPICDAICKICFQDDIYDHLRTPEEQRYLDQLYERHGHQASAIYQFGKTKIFFRAGQVGYLERIRAQKLRNFTITMQRFVRGWLARVSYARLRELHLEQMRREASLQNLASLQNQVNSLQAELEQVKEERAEEQTDSVSRIESLYQFSINMMYSTIQPLIIPAILEHEALDPPEPFASFESRSESPDRQPMEDLIRELDRYFEYMVSNHVPQDVSVQAYKQMFYLICAQSLNQLLIRRDLCQFRKAMQINFNLSCLVQWCREKYLVHWREIVEQLDPITQATKLLQTRKSSDDIATIEEVCNKLRPSQIIKLLNMYTSTYEEQITTDFIHELEEHLYKTREDSILVEDDDIALNQTELVDGNNNNGANGPLGNNELLMDTKIIFKFVDVES